MKKKRSKRVTDQIDESWNLRSHNFYVAKAGLTRDQKEVFDQKVNQIIGNIYEHFYAQKDPWDISYSTYEGELAWAIMPKYDWYLTSKIIAMGLMLKMVNNEWVIHKPTKEEKKCIAKRIELKKSLGL